MAVRVVEEGGEAPSPEGEPGARRCATGPGILHQKSGSTASMPAQPPKRVITFNQFFGLGNTRFFSKRKVGYARKIVASFWFQSVMGGSLIFALFGGSFWPILDLADQDWNDLRDLLMVIVMTFFGVEIMLLCISSTNYRFSFFFWMDVLGTVSMVFEVSWMLGDIGRNRDTTTANSSNMILLRTTRGAKLGARAARFSKMVKLVTLLHKRQSDQEQKQRQNQPKIISQQLMQVLSAKVAFLTILVVMIIPLFQIGVFPETDFSTKAWVKLLDKEYLMAKEEAVVSNRSHIFQDAVVRFVDFYADKNYFPFEIQGYDEVVPFDGAVLHIPGRSILQLDAPQRAQNIAVIASGLQSDWHVLFDFRDPSRNEELQGLLLIAFVIVVMVMFSFNLNQILDEIVVVPLGRMLGSVREMTRNIWSQVHAMSGSGGGDEDKNAVDGLSETEKLEYIVHRLAKISQAVLKRHAVNAEEMAGLSAEGKGVLDLMQPDAMVVRLEKDPGGWSRPTQEVEVPDLPVAAELIDSWALDVLSLMPQERHVVVGWLVFHSHLGNWLQNAGWLPDAGLFRRFQEVVEAGYMNHSYHNAIHAADVCHTVYRVMAETGAKEWLSSLDAYALLVAALCHDIGHPGVNNAYLVETGHELALRYNDRSPLENMHCSKLFEIVADTNTDVFCRLSQEEYKDVRKVCVATILHTDNANHYQMVKDVNVLYELSSAVCDRQAENPRVRLQQYDDEVLRSADNRMAFLELFLHLADVSNPLKPFNICEVPVCRTRPKSFSDCHGLSVFLLGVGGACIGGVLFAGRSGEKTGYSSWHVKRSCDNQPGPVANRIH